VTQNTTTLARPDFVTDAHLDYLDHLRESGETNMYGAARYLDEEFPELKDGARKSYHASDKAQTILGYWMRTFGGAR